MSKRPISKRDRGAFRKNPPKSWFRQRMGLHRFRGLRYSVFVVNGDEPEWMRDLRGATTDRRAPRRLMFLLGPWLAGPAGPVLALHEGLHAAFGSKLSEAEVERGAIDLCGFLARFGFLRPPSKRGGKRGRR